jgi:pyridoxal phosphate enzyme (YggS family)
VSRADEIRANIAALEARIVAACTRAGRKRDEVTLVAVSKTFPASDVELAIDAGMTDVGENKVQEARDKKPDVSRKARWHLIGHLQSNKVKDAVRLFDVIQTVDSIALAEKIARSSPSVPRLLSSSGPQPRTRGPEAPRNPALLLQVNIGREPQKSGVDPSEVAALAKRVELKGLMAIPPAGEAEDVRPYFRELRALRDECGLQELSMGMTDDFEVAIEEGATIIRVGRAIFGNR